MKCRFFLILFVTVVIFNGSLHGQNNKSANGITQILKNTSNDPAITKIEQLINTNYQLNYTLPFINSINFRYGIMGSVFRDPIYGDFVNEGVYNVNLETNSFTKIKLQKSLKEIQQNIYKAQKEITFCNALVSRYDLLIDLISNYENLSYAQQTFNLLSEQKKIYEITLAQNKTVDIKEVIQLEEDLNTITSKITNLTTDFKKLQLDYQSINNTEFTEKELLVYDKPTISTITSVINSLEFDESISNEKLLTERQINYKETELAILKNKYFNFFKGIQIGYDQQIFDIETPDKQKARNNFGIRANFSIPLPLSYKRDLNYIQEKLRLENYQTNIVKENNQNKIDFYQTKELIKHQIQVYQNQLNKLSQSLIHKMATNNSLKNEMTLYEWNQLQLVYLKQKNNLNVSHLDIFSNYIKLLKLSGKIHQTPLINYLSNELELL